MVDFPASPTIGDQFTDGGFIWEWDGVKWTVVPGGASGGPFLELAGGTMTGDLTLAADPLNPLDAATKEYVDNSVFLPLSGGTLTGSLLGTDATFTSSASVGDSNLSATIANTGFSFSAFRSGFAARLSSTVAGVSRWTVLLNDGVPETGSNTGSDFSIRNFSDAGVQLGTPLAINRATGLVTIPNLAAANYLPLAGGTLTGPLTINGAIAASGAATFGGEISSPAWSYSGDANFNLSAAPTERYLQFAAQWYWGWNTATGTLRWVGNPGTPTQLFTLDPSGDVSCTGTLTANVVLGNSAITTYGPVTTYIGITGLRGQGSGTLGQPYTFFWNNTALECYIGPVYVGDVTGVSDYRIKKDVAPLPSMWDQVKGLNPISYTHKDYTPANPAPHEDPPPPLIQGDDIERWGFIAHELQETLIESAATGVKDQPDMIQSPNQWAVITALTKALQEAMERIEALESAARTRPAPRSGPRK
jgi:Chaperone of endosialidase